MEGVDGTAFELENIRRALDRSAIVVITDTRGVITSVNDKFCEISGYAREELVGQTHKIVNSGFHSPAFFTQLWSTIAAGDVWEGEIRNRRKDGSNYWVHTTIVPFLNQKGRLERYVSIRFEITARKEGEVKLQEYALKLERSNRDLENFASLAAHDLQEPLRKIQAFADRIVSKEADRLSVQGATYLTKIVDAAGRMRHLVSDILMLARVSTHGEEPRTTSLEVALKEALEDLELRIEESGAHIAHTNLPEVRADPSQMRQLFLNLVGNALKFRAQGRIPRIDITATQSGIGSLNVEVRDNGIGFCPSYAERIFKPFQRLHSRSEYAGNGIGLALCQRIVERHGGSLVVQSKVGEGSVFRFSLPLTDKETNGT